MSTLKFGEQEAGEDLMSAALFVEECEGEDEGAPQDGMAYLRAVRAERKQCPNTVTASNLPPLPRTTPKEQKAKAEVKVIGENVYGGMATEVQDERVVGAGRVKVPPPPGCCPGVAWQRKQVKQFSQLRLKMGKHVTFVKSKGEKPTKVPDKQNEALWCHLMMGGRVWQEVLAEREEEGRIVQDDVKGESPTVTFLTSIPVHVCETLLDYLTTWVASTGWKEGYGPWIYAVLTRLEKPLTPDVGSKLRDLALECSFIREYLAQQRTEDVTDGGIATMNLFICLVSRYFDQTDLVDCDEQ